MNDVAVFAPSPVLTVTVEDHPDGADIHLHAGGQGIWQARMLRALGTSVTMCAVFSGESGRVLHHLLDDEGFHVLAVHRDGRGGAYVHDRRGGVRIKIAETAGEPLSRHELDKLYGLTLRAGLDAGTTILSGPAGLNILSPDVYRRLAADLRTAGRRVIADLSGERLTAALKGGVTVVKVSDEELLADNRVPDTSEEQLIAAMHRLQREGAENVIVSRAGEYALLLAEDEVSEVHMPKLQIADTTGAGDSMTAGVAATLAGGGTIEEAVALGAAAGALNVTRHGLGTGEAEAIYKLRELVRIHPAETDSTGLTRLSPADLARRVREE
ncbi:MULTISPECIES: PfkB family carbohydrate kinase [unclassified Salinibacterium]|uniref:1-phosphofructokinase family hexose kinase n=1 Tax=unclassified Salinibacterium TaxID=2632331 RepID=UPI0014244432|nr:MULTISPECIES: PfkB family carbohydrate kinase [unclassified Salinibacterium]